MTVELVVLLLGLAGLTLAGTLVARENDAKVRVATVAGALAGFLLALLTALVAGKGALAAIAVATTGSATLALALLGQWLLVRALTRAGGSRRP